MIVFVVQPENHRWVARNLNQEVTKSAKPVPTKHLHLLQDSFGLVEFGIAGGENMVPEEGNLLFQRAASVNHAVQPVSLTAFDINQAVLVDMVAPDEVFIFQRGWSVLRMEQFFNCRLVAFGYVTLYFLTTSTKSGAA